MEMSRSLEEIMAELVVTPEPEVFPEGTFMPEEAMSMNIYKMYDFIKARSRRKVMNRMKELLLPSEIKAIQRSLWRQKKYFVSVKEAKERKIRRATYRDVVDTFAKRYGVDYEAKAIPHLGTVLWAWDTRGTKKGQAWRLLAKLSKAKVRSNEAKIVGHSQRVEERHKKLKKEWGDIV